LVRHDEEGPVTEQPPTPVRDWRTDWDHGDPAWAADPFGIWADLRAHCPVAATGRYGGAWMVTTYDLVDEVIHDPARFSSRETGVRPPGTNTKKSPPITSDPPEHQEYRRILQRSFAPAAIGALEDGIRDYCRELIDGVRGRRTMDAAHEYSRHIPTRAIILLLALPKEDAETFRGWVKAIMETGHTDQRARERATAALKSYLMPLIEKRRGSDADDVLTTVANAQLDGQPLSNEMANGMAYLLVVAGIDTTWSALGTALWHLGSHPGDLARLVAEPELVPAAVEEFLRLYAPVSVGRIATIDTELGGCPIKAGDRLLVPFGAANRDGAHVERPDDFVLDRDVIRHAAFGLGVHRCLGSNLARLELRVALEEWLRAFPSYRVVDPAAITWTLGHVRGPHAVPIEVTGGSDAP
jgi:cytochrome P450